MELRTKRDPKSSCVSCKNPIGENGTVTRCRSCADKHNKLYRTCKKKGFCWDCRQPLPLNHTKTRCSECGKKGVISSKNRRDYLRKIGKCVECGAEYTITTGKDTYCDMCFLKRTARMHLGSRTRWKELRTLWERQNGTCSYTGVRLQLGLDASIDHMLPKSRYPDLLLDINNLEWVHIRINLMKHNLTKTEFLNVIKDIHDYSFLSQGPKNDRNTPGTIIPPGILHHNWPVVRGLLHTNPQHSN